MGLVWTDLECHFLISILSLCFSDPLDGPRLSASLAPAQLADGLRYRAS